MRDLQKVLEALTSPIRREILSLIWDRPVPAGQIAAAFDVTKPTISQHLAVLRDAGLVTATVAGTSRLYQARPEALRGLHAALGTPDKWTTADDVPERFLADSLTELVVVACTEVETDQATTFAAFVDPAVYSRWLGVPVQLEDGRFSCRMEWGTQVRGWYDVVSPPRLIAMRWDFEDDNVPVPGNELTCYLRVHQSGEGALVEVHQLVETSTQAEFMEVAWTLVLGRLKSGVVEASKLEVPMAARPSRAKRRRLA
jgi:DNA-binding transcriptional ArsR family regulator